MSSHKRSGAITIVVVFMVLGAFAYLVASREAAMAAFAKSRRRQ